MTTEEIIIRIFCLADDQLYGVPKVPQAKLYPSEIVTIGILFALKGIHFRAFYRWLRRDFDQLFGRLPHRICCGNCANNRSTLAISWFNRVS